MYKNTKNKTAYSDAPALLALNDHRLNALVRAIQQHHSIITAFSGGVDSTLVAVVSRIVLGKKNAFAAIGISNSLAKHDQQQAFDISKKFDLNLIQVKPAEQSDPNYLKNDANRCFHCKTHLYQLLYQEATDRNITAIANGTNTDDLTDYRPGLQAASNFKVISPLIQAQLNKNDVRQIAKIIGIHNWNKPASPCLASRIAYGIKVTPQKLTQIQNAEAILRHIGIQNNRVRHHGDIARIEIPWQDMPILMQEKNRLKIATKFKALGFKFVSLDIEGFKSGSGNVLLGKSMITQN